MAPKRTRRRRSPWRRRWICPEGGCSPWRGPREADSAVELLPVESSPQWSRRPGPPFPILLCCLWEGGRRVCKRGRCFSLAFDSHCCSLLLTGTKRTMFGCFGEMYVSSDEKHRFTGNKLVCPWEVFVDHREVLRVPRKMPGCPWTSCLRTLRRCYIAQRRCLHAPETCRGAPLLCCLAPNLVLGHSGHVLVCLQEKMVCSCKVLGCPEEMPACPRKTLGYTREILGLQGR